MKPVKALLLLCVSGNVLAACSDLSAPPVETRRWGSVVISGQTVSDTTVSATVMAKFFHAPMSSVTNSVEAARTDACTIFSTDTTVSEVIGEKKAGDKLSFAVGTERIDLDWLPVQFRYDSPHDSSLIYRTGQTGTVTVPGNGEDFPAGSVSVLLAEPLIVNDVTMESGHPIALSWNGSSSGTSAILVNLLYAWPATSSYANRMVACELKDDGSATIPGALLVDFHQSPMIRRSLTVTRFRTNFVDLDDRTQLHINSAVEAVVPLH